LIRRAAALGTLAVLALTIAAAARGEPETQRRGQFNVTRDEVASGLNQPIYTAFAPGVAGTAYVVEREGTVRALDPSDGSSVQFLDIQTRVSTAGEGGLLSIAFDPDFQSNRLFYAYYTTDGSHRIAIDEFEAPSDTDADEASRRRVLAIPHPGFENHQGGTVAFGPGGYLFAATGDGGSGGDPPENAQDRTVLLGKLLRIDPHGDGDGDYSVPPTNPFRGRKGRDEIYALGLRNPFRFSFDEPTDRIAIGDVGQSRWEEVDIESRKSLRTANFGWDHYEGDHTFDYAGDNEAPKPSGQSYEPPVHEYPHSQGNVITGGVVVRDPDLPTLQGRYVYADFGSNNLRSFRVKLTGARNDKPLGIEVATPTSFASAPNGTVYVTSLNTGRLFRLVPGM
jgi:glucose/arabinose dehydrogenase